MTRKRMLTKDVIEAAEELAVTGAERAFAAISKRFMLAESTPKTWYYKGGEYLKRKEDPNLGERERLCIEFYKAIKRGCERGPAVLSGVLPQELIAQLTR